MPPFAIDQLKDQDQVRLAVHGELDIETGPRLRDELGRAFALGPALLVLDLRDVTFFDSTGLQIVLDADVRSRAEGCTLVVVPGEGEPRRVFELADVLEMLTTEEPSRRGGSA